MTAVPALVLSDSQAAILFFAERMAAAGTVTVSSPTHPDLVEHRVVAHDTEGDGYTVVFIDVVDGQPVVTSMNFLFDADVAARHLPHADGLGLTMCDARHRPLVTYRVG